MALKVHVLTLKLSTLVMRVMVVLQEDIKRAIAPMGAAAAWGLYQWNLMDDYLLYMKEDTPDGAFFRYDGGVRVEAHGL